MANQEQVIIDSVKGYFSALHSSFPPAEVPDTISPEARSLEGVLGVIVGRLDGVADLGELQAEVAALRRTVAPDLAEHSPLAILGGDLGDETAIAFMQGALSLTGALVGDQIANT